MKMKLLSTAFFLFLLLCSPAMGWDGTIVSVHDGDTIKVRRADSGEVVRIRLHGIDAPEFPGRGWGAQPYCKVACNFLRALLPDGSRVAVMDMGFDKYSRTVAGIVSLPGGKVVQEELLRAGLVWVYPKYCPDCRQWKELERQAREERRGLWRSKAPMPPWEWRHKGQEQHKTALPKGKTTGIR